MKNRITSAFLITIAVFILVPVHIESKQPSVEEFMKYVEEKDSSLNLQDLLTQGEMQGYYKLSYFWNLYEKLALKYPKYVSKKAKIGSTYLKREIHTFYIGNQVGKIFNNPAIFFGKLTPTRGKKIREKEYDFVHSSSPCQRSLESLHVIQHLPDQLKIIGS